MKTRGTPISGNPIFGFASISSGSTHPGLALATNKTRGAQEITRRVNCENVWQAVYTAGVVLPRPVSECRRLDWGWLKLLGKPSKYKAQVFKRQHSWVDKEAMFCWTHLGQLPRCTEDIITVH